MKKSVRFFWIVFGLGVLSVALVIGLAAAGVFGKMPSIKELENPTLLESSEVYAIDGTLMGKYNRERGNRSNVSYRDISPNVINALVSTEDERFYEHSGIDAKSSFRALVLLGRDGGGSTITQQLAKTLLEQGGHHNIVKRILEKIKEYIIAVKLERNFTKEEILALYLNAVPFGNNIYGIRNAARSYFQKEPDRLTVDEAALLVGMLKGNTLYNPLRNPKLALDRRNVVINQMVKNNALPEAEATKLKAKPIQLAYRKLDENNGYAPYFREVLKNEVRDILKTLQKPDGSEYDIYDDGLKIYTTINVKWQQYAEEAVANSMPTLQAGLDKVKSIRTGSVWKGHEKTLERYIRESDRWWHLKETGMDEKEIRATFNVKTPMTVFAWNADREKDTVMTPLDSIKYHRQMLQSSFLVMDPITGEIRAWVGGIDYKTYKFDHANINTKRQVGSSIKPLLYTQAVEERGFTGETEIPNEPQYFEGNGWVPAGKNCPGKPEVSMAGALAYSLNCASAYIMKQVGPDAFEDFIKNKINLPTDIGPYPANALGACDLSLYEMMWAYSIFAGKGFSSKPYFITRIEDRNGNVIKRFDYSMNRKESISEATAYRMTQMMQGTVDIGTARGLRERLGAAEMGGKTGTTNDNSDAWYMGYVPQLEAGVWVGCDDRFIRNESSYYQGGFAARPIWEYFFKKLYADKNSGLDKSARFTKPADFVNTINPGDFIDLEDIEPGAEGEDMGAGSSDQFTPSDTYIAPESKPYREEGQKDTVNKKKQPDPKIGEEKEKDEKKKGFFKKLFGKKDNEE